MAKALNAPLAVVDIFLIFLRLGLTSFGGPVAHLGYFRDTFVRQRSWLSERQYADLVALCQLLPGPASSKVGMALGLSQRGYPGLLAAWFGFTLPSALLLILAAAGLSVLAADWLSGAIGGLKVVAVVVVAQALLGMYRGLVRGWRARLLMLASAAIMLLWGGVWSQLLVIGGGALVGSLWLRHSAPQAPQTALFARWIGVRAARFWLLLFLGLLLLLPWLASSSGQPSMQLFDALYRSGALVFGGGHVVLPLLQHEVVATGMIDEGRFLAGYGLAQALPGPLFTLSAYIGAVEAAPAGLGVMLVGGLLATLAIFLPAFLLLVGCLPYWERLCRQRGMFAALAGVNAVVVGLLLAALWNPVILSAIHGPREVGLMLLLALLIRRRLPVGIVVLTGAVGGVLLLQG